MAVLLRQSGMRSVFLPNNVQSAASVVWNIKEQMFEAFKGLRFEHRQPLFIYFLK